MTNSYDLRCGWCDARFGDKQARIFHEQEEHGMTDEQINRFLGGKSRWDTHELAPQGVSDHPYGPGLNVTVPRAMPIINPMHGFYTDENMPLPEDKMACLEGEEFACGTDDGITDADLAPQMLVTAGAICQQAADITAGDRQQQNGDKLPNHENISDLWSAYLGVEISAEQVAIMMVLLKVARTKLGAFNTDDYVDMAGYAGCAAEIRHRSSQ